MFLHTCLSFCPQIGGNTFPACTIGYMSSIRGFGFSQHASDRAGCLEGGIPPGTRNVSGTNPTGRLNCPQIRIQIGKNIGKLAIKGDA